ncbi:MAG: phospholipid carrier-dependent glycosyltransferase, partial [Cyanobacteria bacterium K_DeepCast_0m_m1_088]|nr:phospholipid carrier-dependent glycosyltransferase [Cyanobacteria bacterium K_DeepCast_0m_m1_088]
MNAQRAKPPSALPRNRSFWLAVAAVLALALALRIIPLTLKAPWMDEAATTIFSLGNSSRSMPVNQLVDLQSFLRPLTGRPWADPAAVLHHLINEDNHPPLYFLLAHGWHYLLQPGSELASIGISRLLPALFGVLAVPLSLWTGWLALGTRRGALLSGLWMAISPLAVAQSLEIRHYSLAIVLSAASLLCFVKTWSLDQQG